MVLAAEGDSPVSVTVIVFHGAELDHQLLLDPLSRLKRDPPEQPRETQMRPRVVRAGSRMDSMWTPYE